MDIPGRMYGRGPKTGERAPLVKTDWRPIPDNVDMHLGSLLYDDYIASKPIPITFKSKSGIVRALWPEAGIEARGATLGDAIESIQRAIAKEADSGSLAVLEYVKRRPNL